MNTTASRKINEHIQIPEIIMKTFKKINASPPLFYSTRKICFYQKCPQLLSLIGSSSIYDSIHPTLQLFAKL